MNNTYDKTKSDIENFTIFLEKLASVQNGLIKSSDLSKFKDAYLKRIEEKLKPTATERLPAPVSLKQSKAGNLIHEPTSLVFIKSSKHGDVCVGFEDEGKIKPLTMKHCIICSQNSWKYNLKSCIKSATTTIGNEFAINIDDTEFKLPN